MTKMSNPQMNLILAAHNRPAKATPYGARGEIVLPSRLHASGEVLRRNGWATQGDHGWLNVTRAGLVAAGVDMDAIHAQALADHALWGTGRAGYQAAMNALHAEALVENFTRQPHMVRAAEIRIAEQQRAAVDNRAEIGAPRTQRFHSLFKITRNWRAALDILHAEALGQ